MVPGYPHRPPPEDGDRTLGLAQSLLLVFVCFTVWETHPFSSEIWAIWKGCEKHSVSCHDAARFGINNFLKTPPMERSAVKCCPLGVTWWLHVWAPCGCVYSTKPVQIKPVQKFQHEGGRRPWGQTSRRRLLQKGDSFFVGTTDFPGPGGWPTPISTNCSWIYDLVEPG